ncbi:MAG: glycosyltransferase family 4 protein [Chloroflexi bacterium]|nr:glycosyltransferase family 4 protein [Chloroflexota bacterium]
MFRYLNAAQTFHPDRQHWRERFYKNAPAFRLRSWLASRHFQQLRGQVDLIVQLGVLFDVRWRANTPPSVIYVDYTAYLTAQRPLSGRSPFSERQRRDWLTLERSTFRKASHICTRSSLVRESIIHDYGIAPEKVTAVGGGVNFAQMPSPITYQPTDTPTILFIGKEFYRKGGDILLQAFMQVRQVAPGARLKMLTTHPLPNDFSDSGVEIISPTWDRQAIAALYASADLFVLPSRLETWGDVLLEAMSFGLPCIGVTGEAMAEIIEHEFSGLLVEREDVDSLTVAIIRLLTDFDLRRRLGQQARVQVEQTYNWADVVKRLRHSLISAGVADLSVG